VTVPGHGGALKSAAAVRAIRRAYDGAPPVIPHAPVGVECSACHNERGLEVDGLGFAPPSPHARTSGLSALSRCTQCHVYRTVDDVFVASSFEGFAQDLRAGARLNELAPPVMPHGVFMRENCQACHTGPAAREEIRTSHPERPNCSQCHVPRVTLTTFER
jgi:cytochrome c-type protein NapB